MARRSLGALAVLAVLVLAAPAQAEPRALRVALYAPWSGPSTADERHSLARQIEAAVDGARLGPIAVDSYAKLADFRRAVAAGAVDVAVVDAAVASTLGDRLVVASSWSSGAVWVLAGSAPRRPLRGARLALQAGDAPTSERLVARLLRGQTSARTWSRIVGAPVTADARQLVVRGLADVVVVPRASATGLVELAELGSFGELVLAAAGDVRDGARVGELVRGAIAARLGGAWTTGGPALPRAVGVRSLIAAPAQAAEPSVVDLLAPAHPWSPSGPLDDLWIDADAP